MRATTPRPSTKVDEMATGGNPKTSGSGKPSGRVTPKGGPAAAQAARARAAAGAKSGDSASSRYTPPQPKYAKESPPWVPAVMFTLLGLGMLTIFMNYLGVLPGGTSGWWLLPGLACITGGIIAATYYR